MRPPPPTMASTKPANKDASVTINISMLVLSQAKKEQMFRSSGV
jgi:hypothetical protein